MRGGPFRQQIRQIPSTSDDQLFVPQLKRQLRRVPGRTVYGGQDLTPRAHVLIGPDSSSPGPGRNDSPVHLVHTQSSSGRGYSVFSSRFDLSRTASPFDSTHLVHRQRAGRRLTAGASRQRPLQHGHITTAIDHFTAPF